VRRALHAEWTKLRTVPGPLWLLLGMIAATVALGAVTAAVLGCRPAGCDDDAAVRIGLVGVQLGQALAAVLAVLVISGEYGSGMIRMTLTAMPRRAMVLAAKALTLAGAVAVAGTLAVCGSLLAVRLVLHRAALPPVDGTTLRAAAGAVLYLVVIGLLSLGVATLVRDSATGMGVVLALLYLLPVLSRTVGDPQWQRRLEQLAPTTAGLTVTVVWAAAALLAAAVVLCRRDP
jgi:ABC-2 type transport system permease protein